MSDLNKFGVIRLLHFDKGILSSHVAEFHYQKLRHFQKDMVFCIREKDWLLILKVMIKNLFCCFYTETHYSSILDYSVLFYT